MKNSNSKNKCSTAFDEFYCMKCHDARKAYRNEISVVQEVSFLRVKSTCRDCKSTMNKSYKIEKFPLLRKNFSVVGVSELYDCTKPSNKTHISPNVKGHANEPCIGHQYELLL